MRHNHVSLLGIVEKKPRIDKDEATGVYKQGLGMLKIIRGSRDVGDHRTTSKYDSPFLWSFDPNMVEQMDKWEEGDAVLVKGTINTKAIQKSSWCKHCNAKNLSAGIIVYVTPIHILKVNHLKSDNDILHFLKDNEEISNSVQVIGTVVREPKKLTPIIGLLVTQYQIALNRKKMIPTDPPEIRTDYPWVKSYGDNATSDKLRLHVGSEIYIDGCLQARNIMRHATCAECGQEYEWKDNAMEIVPFATEYLTNFYSDEDIAEMENQKMEQAMQDVFRKKNSSSDEISEEDIEAGIDTFEKRKPE